MGFYKIKRALAVAGGSVHIGADTNIYRSAANVLKTDDALTVALALTAPTKLVAPYTTDSGTVDTNGQIQFEQKSNRSYLLYQCGGTPCYITLPQVTAGTMLVTVGGTP